MKGELWSLARGLTPAHLQRGADSAGALRGCILITPQVSAQGASSTQQREEPMSVTLNEAVDSRLSSKQTYVNLKYHILDADNHLDGQDPDTWKKRVAPHLQERAPKFVTLPDGRYAWSYDAGKHVVPMNSWGTAGLSGESYLRYINPTPTYGDSYDPKVRLRALDLDGVYGALVFGIGGLGKGLNQFYDERELLIAYYQAYNDWLIEDYCGPSNGRLLSVAGLPWTGVKDAIAEMERCKARGHSAVNLGTFPNGGQLPRPEDDEFWAAAQDLNMPLAIHVSNGFLDNPSGMDKVYGFGVAHKCGASTINTVDVLLGQGIPERFPKLRFGLIEANIGWIPHFLEQLDYYFLAHRLRNKKAHLTMTPSEMFKQSFWTSFMWDPVGVAMRHHIGIDKIMWSTDFPHGGGEWPRSRLQMEALFRGVPDNEMKLMLHDNFCDYLGLRDL